MELFKAGGEAEGPVTENQVNELHLSMLCGMVGTAGQWAGFDMGKAHGQGLGFQVRKFSRLIIANDRHMPFGRLQVLTDRDDVTSGRPQIV